MCKIICIANQKKNSGKTATAVNVAASLGLFEQRTLIVDCDPQASATKWMGLDYCKTQSRQLGLYHAFMGRANAEDICRDSQIPLLKVIPSNIDLCQAEYKLAVKPGKEMILKKLANSLEDNFDYIIIDTPSSLGYFTICGMAAAHRLIITIDCNGRNEDFYGLNHLLQMAQMTREELNPELKVGGLVLTKCRGNGDAEQMFEKDGLKDIKELFFETGIVEDKKINDAFNRAMPAALNDVISKGAESYFNLSKELIRIL